MCPSVVAGRGARGGGEMEGVTRGRVGVEKARGLGESGQQGVRFRREQPGTEQGTDRQKRGRCGPSVAARGRNCTYDADQGRLLLVGKNT